MKRLPCFIIALILCMAIPWAVASADITANAPLVANPPAEELTPHTDLPFVKCGDGEREAGEQCDPNCDASINPDCNLCAKAGPAYVCNPDTCQCTCSSLAGSQVCPPPVICNDGQATGTEERAGAGRLDK